MVCFVGVKSVCHLKGAHKAGIKGGNNGKENTKAEHRIVNRACKKKDENKETENKASEKCLSEIPCKSFPEILHCDS